MRLIETAVSGDTMPARCEIIEVRVTELSQLFNAIDPAPFRERDLDPKVEEFIVESAREAPRDLPLGLLVRLDRAAGLPDEADQLRVAVHRYFARSAGVSRRRLRHLFREGRVSLVIGLAALAAFTGVAELVASRAGGGVGAVLHESLLIGGWVAMWRPLEVFLYDWWPIRAEAKLFDRLAAMPVGISRTSRA